jgi:ribonuclease P protein component
MAAETLRYDRQFRMVYRRGARVAGSKVIVYYLKVGGEGILPGFVASKRMVGKAHQRNKAKRLMREIFKRLKDRITEKNIMIVFIASFQPAETSLHELFEDVEGTLRRAGIISHCG